MTDFGESIGDYAYSSLIGHGVVLDRILNETLKSKDESSLVKVSELEGFSDAVEFFYTKEAQLLLTGYVHPFEGIDKEITQNIRNNTAQLDPEGIKFVVMKAIETINSVRNRVNQYHIPVEWKNIKHTQETKKLILELSKNLELVMTLANANLPSKKRAISQLEYAQLVSLLETTLNVLKSPLVEKSLMEATSESLGEVVRKTAKEKTEQGLGKAADAALKTLMEFILKVWGSGGF